MRRWEGRKGRIGRRTTSITNRLAQRIASPERSRIRITIGADKHVLIAPWAWMVLR